MDARSACDPTTSTQDFLNYITTLPNDRLERLTKAMRLCSLQNPLDVAQAADDDQGGTVRTFSARYKVLDKLLKARQDPDHIATDDTLAALARDIVECAEARATEEGGLHELSELQKTTRDDLLDLCAALLQSTAAVSSSANDETNLSLGIGKLAIG